MFTNTITNRTSPVCQEEFEDTKAESVNRGRTDNTMNKRRRTDNTMNKRRRTDNTMNKRKMTKGQTTIYKTYTQKNSKI
jgi:hypothetical protein